jgi:multidrug efflux pump subunit AcrA (membrane-fusion protein)
VAYVVGGGSVERRPVTILRRSREQVAIAAGLREGEHVSLKEPATEDGSR